MHMPMPMCRHASFKHQFLCKGSAAHVYPRAHPPCLFTCVHELRIHHVAYLSKGLTVSMLLSAAAPQSLPQSFGTSEHSLLSSRRAFVPGHTTQALLARLCTFLHTCRLVDLSMCACLHTCCTCLYACVYTCTCIGLHTCLSTCLHTYTWSHTCVHTHLAGRLGVGV